MTRLLIPLLLASAPFSWSSSGPGESNDFHGKRVLIIGVDGLRPDALKVADAPNIAALEKSGTFTFTAFAGGRPSTPGQQPTISGPGWSSILTGTCTDKHGVTGNSVTPGLYHVEAAPHFAKRLKETVPTASFASFTSWNWIEDYLIAAQPELIDHHVKGIGPDEPLRDIDVKTKAVAYLAEENPDVMFIHFNQVDGAGHSTGFTPENPNYMQAITIVDKLIGEVMDAVQARPQFSKESWMVILTADHGGKVRAHGGQSPEERTIPMIVSGPLIPKLGLTAETPGQFVVPATTLLYLGVPINPEWGWEPGTFGVKSN